jgi:hypothetical protein
VLDPDCEGMVKVKLCTHYTLYSYCALKVKLFIKEGRSGMATTTTELYMPDQVTPQTDNAVYNSVSAVLPLLMCASPTRY